MSAESSQPTAAERARAARTAVMQMVAELQAEAVREYQEMLMTSRRRRTEETDRA